MALGRAVATIGGWTVLSRLVGLAREMVVANYLGAGMVADAFVVACRFPNMFRALFAEGAFNAAFVPLFTSKLESEGRDAARAFAEQAYAVLACLLLLVIIAMEILMPWAMAVMAPGFDDLPGKRALTIEFSRIAFPYLLFISLVSLQSGVLNGLGRFAAAAGTPVLLSVVSMIFIVAFGSVMPSVGHAATWGVFASGIAQFLWLLWSMSRAAMRLRLVRPVLTPEVRQLLRKVVPGALGAGVYQVNMWINTAMASNVANGAVSHLYYADRINQLPLGVVGIAIGTALLPTLTRQLKSGDAGAATASQNRAMEMGLLFTLPAAFAFAVIAGPIITLLYQHGKFTEDDSLHVARTLVAFAFGLPAFVLIKVLTPSFFARHDTGTPVRIAMICMVVNVVLNLVLMRPFQEMGMALATTVAAWLNLFMLSWELRRRDLFALDQRLLARAWRMLLCAALMALALKGAAILLAPLAAWHLPFVAVLIGIGSFVYAALIFGTGAMTIADLKSMLRRSRPTPVDSLAVAQRDGD